MRAKINLIAQTGRGGVVCRKHYSSAPLLRSEFRMLELVAKPRLSPGRTVAASRKNNPALLSRHPEHTAHLSQLFQKVRALKKSDQYLKKGFRILHEKAIATEQSHSQEP